jgi:peptidoglycan/LPS O-acetylase OafA/YrhL
MSRPRLTALSGLRFLAAVHLVAFHALAMGQLPAIPRGGPLEAFISAGYTTTSFFLIVSGFLLYYGYVTADGACRVRPVTLVRNRLASFYPVAILGHLLAVPAALWGSHAIPRDELLPRALAVLTLVNAWIPTWTFSFNGPGWTLSCLVVYYLAFPWLGPRVARLSDRAALVVLVGTLAVSQLLAFGYLAIEPEAWGARGTLVESPLAMALHSFPLVRFWEFLSGVALARVLLHSRPEARVARWMTGASPGVALGLLVACLAFASSYLPYNALHNGMLLPLHWLVIASLLHPRGLAGRALTARRLVALGDASMPVYLIHLPLLVMLKAGGQYVGLAPSTIVTILAAAAIIAVAHVLHHRFARPLADRLRVPGRSRGPAGETAIPRLTPRANPAVA